MDFEKLQKAWQQQPVQAVPTTQKSDGYNLQILSKVKRMQRQILFSNIMVTLLIAAYGVFFWLFWMKDFGDSVSSKLGIMFLFLGLGLSGWAGWMKSRPWSKAAASLSSKAFLQKSLKGFRFILQAQQVYVPVSFSLFGAGIQLLLFGLMEDSTLVHRILAHVGSAAMLVFVGGVGSYTQKLKYKEKYQPVVKELEEMLQALEQEQD